MFVVTSNNEIVNLAQYARVNIKASERIPNAPAPEMFRHVIYAFPNPDNDDDKKLLGAWGGTKENVSKAKDVLDKLTAALKEDAAVFDFRSWLE